MHRTLIVHELHPLLYSKYILLFDKYTKQSILMSLLHTVLGKPDLRHRSRKEQLLNFRSSGSSGYVVHIDSISGAHAHEIQFFLANSVLLSFWLIVSNLCYGCPHILPLNFLKGLKGRVGPAISHFLCRYRIL